MGLAVAACAALLAPAGAGAAAGDLDTTFGTGGFANPSLPRSGDVAVAATGRILVPLGPSERLHDTFTVAALTPSGELDRSFGIDGVVWLGIHEAQNFWTHQIEVDSQDRILLLGEGHKESGEQFDAILRLTPEGDFDPSFGLRELPVGGVMTLDGDDGVVLASGGNQEFRFARLSNEGDLDTDFGVNGVAHVAGPPFTSSHGGYGVSASEVAIASDGKIVAVGGRHYPLADPSPSAVARVTSDGEPDPSFGPANHRGFSTAPDRDGLTGVQALNDGRIVVTGRMSFGRSFMIARLADDGTLDPSFGNGGITETFLGDYNGNSWSGENFPVAVLRQSDGKYIVVGSAGDSGVADDKSFALVRYTPDGQIDPSFGAAGKVRTDVGTDTSAAAAVLDDQQRILVTGLALDSRGLYTTLARFLTTGGGASDGGGGGEVKGIVSGRGIEVHRLLVPRSPRKLIRNGIRVLASCEEDCRIVVLVRVSNGVAIQMGLGGFVVAHGSAPAAAGERRWVVAKLTGAAKRAMRSYEGGGRFRVTVRAAG